MIELAEKRHEFLGDSLVAKTPRVESVLATTGNPVAIEVAVTDHFSAQLGSTTDGVNDHGAKIMFSFNENVERINNVLVGPAPAIDR